MRRWILVAACLAGPELAWAQQAPSQAALDDAVRLGTMATLAPLCGLRDEAWGFDLRRATLMDATRSRSPEDPALKAAPGRKLVEGALSYAEDEALENFAQSPAAQTCTPLAHDKALPQADAMVSAFRVLKVRPSS